MESHKVTTWPKIHLGRSSIVSSKYSLLAARLSSVLFLAIAVAVLVACTQPSEGTMRGAAQYGGKALTSRTTFTLAELTVNPVEPTVWEEVTVSATVENVGETEGIYAATLKIDGKNIETKDVPIPGGTLKTVDFTLMRDVGPSFDVEIGTMKHRIIRGNTHIGPSFNAGSLKHSVAVREGVLSTWSIGDQFVSKVVSEGIEYELTTKITGEERMEGKEYYIAVLSIDPPYNGFLSTAEMTSYKATRRIKRMQFTTETLGQVVTSAVETSDDPHGFNLYPLEVGKQGEVTVTEITTVRAGEETETDTQINTFLYKVERIEEITVPAGTFRAFVVVKYDTEGTPLSTSWKSDKVKLYDIKEIDHESGDVTRLISYSIAP